MINTSKELSPAIIVMAKAPRAGEVKTRLRPIINEQQAATLAACFFQDTIANARKIAATLIVAYAPANGRALLETLLPENDLLWIEQRGEDLTSRLESALEQAENFGFYPLITIGADSPTLPPDYLKQAIEALRSETADIVLGPTKDGGFYLIGLKKTAMNLFADVAWSTPKVFRQTSERAKQIGLSNLFRLPIWYDIDTPQDLRFLREEIIADEELQIRAPATYRWLLANRSI